MDALRQAFGVRAWQRGEMRVALAPHDSNKTTINPYRITQLRWCWYRAGDSRKENGRIFVAPSFSEILAQSGARATHQDFFGAVLGADLGDAGGFVPGGDGNGGAALFAQSADAAMSRHVDIAGPVTRSGAAYPRNRTRATQSAGSFPAGVSLRQVAGMRYWGRRGKVISLRRIYGESSCHIKGFIYVFSLAWRSVQ